MASQAMKRKVDKRHHWGRGRDYLKGGNYRERLKGVTFFNSAMRKRIKDEAKETGNYD